MDTSAIITALDAATTLFGVCVTLAVLVTGFMVGRHWLKKAGYDDDAHSGEMSPEALAHLNQWLDDNAGQDSGGAEGESERGFSVGEENAREREGEGDWSSVKYDSDGYVESATTSGGQTFTRDDNYDGPTAEEIDKEDTPF